MFDFNIVKILLFSFFLMSVSCKEQDASLDSSYAGSLFSLSIDPHALTLSPVVYENTADHTVTHFSVNMEGTVRGGELLAPFELHNLRFVGNDFDGEYDVQQKNKVLVGSYFYGRKNHTTPKQKLDPDRYIKKPQQNNASTPPKYIAPLNEPTVEQTQKNNSTFKIPDFQNLTSPDPLIKKPKVEQKSEPISFDDQFLDLPKFNEPKKEEQDEPKNYVMLPEYL